MKVKEESEKIGLKLNIQETKTSRSDIHVKKTVKGDRKQGQRGSWEEWLPRGL